MGGFNSGSLRRSGRARDVELERVTSTDVRPALSEIERAGLPVHGVELLLIGEADAVPRVRLSAARAQSLSFGVPMQVVQMTATRPNYGGWRYWFHCPRARCGRRCSVLYREPHTNVRAFRCRTCHRMYYESQVLGWADTLLNRAVKPLRRLVLTAVGPRRPRYMHRATYAKLMSRYSRGIELWEEADPLWRKADASLRRIEEMAKTTIAAQVAGHNSAIASPPSDRRAG